MAVAGIPNAIGGLLAPNELDHLCQQILGRSLRFGPPTRCFARDRLDANEPTSAYEYNGRGQLDGRVVKICY
jgi:hypothetical protein